MSVHSRLQREMNSEQEKKPKIRPGLNTHHHDNQSIIATEIASTIGGDRSERGRVEIQSQSIRVVDIKQTKTIYYDKPKKEKGKRNRQSREPKKPAKKTDMSDFVPTKM